MENALIPIGEVRTHDKYRKPLIEKVWAYKTSDGELCEDKEQAHKYQKND